MCFKGRNALFVGLVLATLLLAPIPLTWAAPETITLTLDDPAVPDSVECGDTWTESGLQLHLLPSALTSCNGGACLFLSQLQQLFLIARLHVDLGSIPGPVTSVEVDVMAACGLCSFASIYDGDSLVDSVTAISGVQTLELSAQGAHVDRLAIDTCIDFFVREIRITFDRQPVDAEPTGGLPSGRTRLLRVRPNPFNPSTSIQFILERSGFAELRIYDLAGRLVRRLLARELTAGSHTTSWDGRDRRGRDAASGQYFFELSLDGRVVSRQKGVLLQ